jgi:hypothetical protein
MLYIFFLTGVLTINLKVKIYFEISTNFYSKIDIIFPLMQRFFTFLQFQKR